MFILKEQQWWEDSFVFTVYPYVNIILIISLTHRDRDRDRCLYPFISLRTLIDIMHSFAPYPNLNHHNYKPKPNSYPEIQF